MDGVCVVYKAGFVGFLVAGGMDAIVDSMTPIRVPRLAWPGLPVVGRTKGTGFPRSNPRKCCLSPTDGFFLERWRKMDRVGMVYIIYNCIV